MGDPLWALWAKKSCSGELRWLPLASHLEDCAAIANRLWENWLSDGVKENIAAHCGCDIDAAKGLYIFVAAAHDCGKATPLFQSQSRFTNSRDLNERIDENLRFCGLPMKSYYEFTNPLATPHALASQLILERAGLSENISVILGSHHGKTPSSVEIINGSIDAQPENFHLEKSGKAQWSAVQQAVVAYAMHISCVADLSLLPLPDMEAQMLLAGLLIIADWISSNEFFFPLLSIDDPVCAGRGHTRASRAFPQADFLRTRWTPDHFWMDADFFETRFLFRENAIQKALQDVAADTGVPGLIILEAPMGAGKTEAALAAAEILADRTGRDGIFFALPTQATSDGIFPRILQWIDHLDSGRHSIELIHGKAHFNDAFLSLQALDGSGEGIWEEADAGQKRPVCAAVASWFSGRKKSMLADFAVGTVDQLLQASLVQKHLMLRHIGLANKVVIVDECHAFDAYMNRYLERTLMWLGAYGVPVIMLSATLPPAKRSAMLGAYLNIRKGLPAVQALPGYPLISYTDSSAVKQRGFEVAAESQLVHIIPEKCDNIVALLETVLKDGGCAGIIVNSVKRAQALAASLKAVFGNDVQLIHSRLVTTDRLRREKVLLAELGKPSSDMQRPARRIVIGTQILEQSLDIDFDVLFTDLCPMDLLLQRIGRLHRHKRKRPASLQDAYCYIFDAGSDTFDPAASAIYGMYLLMRTKALLQNHTILIPDDIARLVQECYGDDDKIFAQTPSGYEEEKAKWKKRTDIQAAKAGSFLLSSPCAEADRTIEGMICTTLDREAAADAKVRDIDGSLEVIAVRKSGDRLTLFSHNSVVLPQDIPDDKTARLIARECLRLPEALCRGQAADAVISAIEQMDSELVPAWQESPWLKGSLILPFDETGRANLCGAVLLYDDFLGLYCKKEGEENERTGI